MSDLEMQSKIRLSSDNIKSAGSKAIRWHNKLQHTVLNNRLTDILPNSWQILKTHPSLALNLSITDTGYRALDT